MTDTGHAAGLPMPDPDCPTCRGAGFVAVEPPPGATFADGPCPACDGPEKRAARRAYAKTLKGQAAEVDTQALAEAFCAWPLPETVCPDRCAWPISGQPSVPRSGTNLLTVAEAKAMFEHLIKSGLLSNRTRSPSVSDDLRRLREAATQGEWYVTPEKTEGSYGGGPNPGEGFESYAIRTRSEKSYEKEKVVLDAINSGVGEVSEEFHEDGVYAWDAVARANLEYVAALVNADRATLAPPSAAVVPDEGWRPEMTPDGMDAGIVLASVRLCASCWEFGARIIGNVRAGDIVRAIDDVEARLAQPAPEASDGSDLREEVGYWRRDAAARIWSAQALMQAYRKQGRDDLAFAHREALRAAVGASEQVQGKHWHAACDLCGKPLLPGEATCGSEVVVCAHVRCAVEDAVDDRGAPDPSDAEWRERVRDGRSALIADSQDDEPAPEAKPAQWVRVEPEATSSKFDATWRPMSSAPRDGTSVLLSCGGATGLGWCAGERYANEWRSYSFEDNESWQPCVPVAWILEYVAALVNADRATLAPPKVAVVPDGVRAGLEEANRLLTIEVAKRRAKAPGYSDGRGNARYDQAVYDQMIVQTALDNARLAQPAPAISVQVKVDTQTEFEELHEFKSMIVNELNLLASDYFNEGLKEINRLRDAASDLETIMSERAWLAAQTAPTQSDRPEAEEPSVRDAICAELDRDAKARLEGTGEYAGLASDQYPPVNRSAKQAEG